MGQGSREGLAELLLPNEECHRGLSSQISEKENRERADEKKKIAGRKGVLRGHGGEIKWGAERGGGLKGGRNLRGQPEPVFLKEIA